MKIIPTFWQALLLIILLVLILFFLFYIAEGIETALGLIVEKINKAVILSALSLLIIIILGTIFTKVPLRDIYYFKKVPVLSYVLLVFATVSSFLVVSQISTAFYLLFPMPDSVIEIFSEYFQNDIGLAFLMVVTPVLEELLFRGLILNGFLKRYKPGYAILFSALLFALFHLNPWQMISSFVFGLFLAWLFVKTRSLLFPILAHIISNSLVVIVIHFPGILPGYSFDTSEKAEFLPVWYIVFSFLLLVGMIYWFQILFKKSGNPDKP